MASDNPCLTCGACCAFYKATFHRSETASACGSVPDELVEDHDSFRVVMRGTRWAKPRCTALHGDIGVSVGCSIYEARSSTCREFPYAWEHGDAHDKCDRARLAWGLAPLQARHEPSTVPLPELPGIEVHAGPDDVAGADATLGSRLVSRTRG